MRCGVLAILMIACLVTGGYCGGTDSKSREKVINAALSAAKRHYPHGKDCKIIMCEEGKLSQEAINKYNPENVYCVMCQYRDKRYRKTIFSSDVRGSVRGSGLTYVYLSHSCSYPLKFLARKRFVSARLRRRLIA